MPTFSAPLDASTSGPLPVGHGYFSLKDLSDNAETLAKQRVRVFSATEGSGSGGVCLECLRASSESDSIPHDPSCVVGKVFGALRTLRQVRLRGGAR